MRTSDFDYTLPPELIAQRPVRPRDSSRLLVLSRADGSIQHRIFSQLPEALQEGDVLVLNDTRVFRARLVGEKEPGGGRAEILLLKQEEERVWEAIVGGRQLVVGKVVLLPNGIRARITEDLGGPRRLVEFDRPGAERAGEMPLPPYITEPLQDPGDYQTVYAEQIGSSAAPTAGFHFTSNLLKKIEAKGVTVEKATLHIGLDTFAPVREDDPRQHPLHTEWCQVSEELADSISRCQGRVVAVGTTSARLLEASGGLPYQGWTDLFILPGYRFKVVDALITNFHLPKSTLLMMVSAFAGHSFIMRAYQEAIRMKYRFYSFGDAMLII